MMADLAELSLFGLKTLLISVYRLIIDLPHVTAFALLTFADGGRRRRALAFWAQDTLFYRFSIDLFIKLVVHRFDSYRWQSLTTAKSDVFQLKNNPNNFVNMTNCSQYLLLNRKLFTMIKK